MLCFESCSKFIEKVQLSFYNFSDGLNKKMNRTTWSTFLLVQAANISLQVNGTQVYCGAQQ